MATKTIADINVAGKAVLMRVDFNVPVADGKITNDKRIKAALPAIEKVIDGGGKLILMSHLGRPDGKYDPEGSLKCCAERLAKLLGRPVKLGPSDVAGQEAQKMASKLKAGEVLMLENVRFNPGETMPDKAKSLHDPQGGKNPDGGLTAEQKKVHEDFIAQLAGMGDVYVNDAFGTCHRKHASMYGVAQAIKAKGGPAVAGFLVEKEIKYLNEAVAGARRPFVAILGGVKVSDKIKLISTLLGKVDKILIGGAMAYTLLKARGASVGRSLVEENQVAAMKELLGKAGDKIVLPSDHIAADEFESDQARRIDDVNIPDGLVGMDIGPRTAKAFGAVIASGKTIVWNGPMGVFEREAYAAGTKAIAQAVAEATDAGAISVIGGGDSAAAVEQMGLEERMTHVSTGGGASLTYLEGKAMPAIEVLDQK